MTPYQLLQIERDRRWMLQRRKLLKQFYSQDIDAIDAEINRCLAGVAYMTSYTLRRDWMIEALRRQRWAIRHPDARFRLHAYDRGSAALKPRFDDENEVLYLLSTPPLKQT